MLAGIAGALLVVTGVWHATEFLMDGRRRDTLRLIPFGVAFLAFGVLIVSFVGGVVAHVLALVFTIASLTLAAQMRGQMDVRPWVMTVFMGLDVVIALCLALSFIL